MTNFPSFIYQKRFLTYLFKVLGLSLLFILIVNAANAQFSCATDELHQYKMNTDPEYKEIYNQQNEAIYRIMSKQEKNQVIRAGVVYTIPVVVHVIHLGEPVGTGSNISDLQITEAIRGLNERYRNIIGNGADIEMEFCLAAQDPQGKATNGIIRVDGSAVPLYASGGIKRTTDSDCNGEAAEDVTMKNLSRWPVNKYYNIWVVNKICGGWAGYAYYPWGGNYDGAVMARAYMNYNSTTLAHELGHGFNLPHTFNGDNTNTTCPVNNNCLNQGDFICDTPPHKQGDCGAANPCTAEGIWNNSRYNYMSYCFPSRANALFTENQKERMRTALSVFPRVSLLSSIACSPPTEYNLALQEISAAESVLCDSLFKPTLKVKNLSNAAVTSFKVNGKLNAVDIAAFNWTGTMAVGEELIFQIQTLKAKVGENVLDLSLSAPNGKVDIDSLDNQLIDTFRYDSPVVTMGSLGKTCLDGAEIVLTSGSPNGGNYSGNGVSGNIFNPQTAGIGSHTIYYSYTNSDNCTSIDSAIITVENCTGIIDLEDIGFHVSLFPNPTKGIISMKINPSNERKIAFEIFNFMGQRIYNEVLNIDQPIVKTVDMTSFPNGAYLFNFKLENKEASVQVMLVK